MSENSVLRFTVSFLLINSRSSFFTKSYQWQCKNRTTWTAVRAPFFLYWPVDVDFVSKKETCTYLKCNLLITALLMNNDIFFSFNFLCLSRELKAEFDFNIFLSFLSVVSEFFFERCGMLRVGINPHALIFT